MAAALAAALVAACGKPADEKPKSGPPATLITTTQVRSGAFEVAEETLGTLEAPIDPKMGAEVAGKVVNVLAFAGKVVRLGETLAVIDAADLALQNQADQAEVKRLEALLAQQDRLVERQSSLAARGFIAQNAVDDVRAQRTAIAEQLAAARARAEVGRRSVGKTNVVAPTDGVVENQFVAAGDYVKVGDPLFQLVSSRRLRAHLPFPEAAAPRLQRGLPVRLTSPLVPGRIFEGRITDIRPSVADGSRAIDVIVDLDNDGPPATRLRAGGTVNAAVQIAAREDALLVPEQSVVLRPAGKVVYAIVDGKARQRVVQAGTKRGGFIEILSGLKVDQTVAQDGAGFLTDGAAVTVKERKEPPPAADATARPAARPDTK